MSSQTVSTKLQWIAEQAVRDPKRVFTTPGTPDRRRLSQGSLSPHAQRCSAGSGRGDRRGVWRRTSTRIFGPPRAAADRALQGAAGEAGVARQGRRRKATDRYARVRGQDRSTGGGHDPGGSLRAGLRRASPTGFGKATASTRHSRVTGAVQGDWRRLDRGRRCGKVLRQPGLEPSAQDHQKEGQ